jgi:hypothetical protein
MGDSSTVLRVIHHLVFRASERFTNHIQDYVKKTNGQKSGMHEDLKYMPDGKFF